MSRTNLKVALVHDYLKEIGGAERVLMVFKEIFPQAPVYTAFKFSRFWGEFAGEMKKWDIRESWAKWIPFKEKLISYLTVISPWFFKSLDLSEFDLVIVSQTGAYFPNGIKTGSKTKLVTYCHTPPRFLYGYPTATRSREKWYLKPISDFVNVFLRYIDFKFAQRPHIFIANSKNVRNRIRKFYRREASVVYPPITPLKSPLKLRGETKSVGYYLVVSRLVGSKNVELAVELAEGGLPVKIAGRPIGKGGEELVEKIRASKAEYLGEVGEEEKAELLAGAKALLCLEKDADFGMTPIEAQMHGTPVIAFRGGGYLESVVEGKTGIFFDELNIDSLVKATGQFEKKEWDEKLIAKQAKKFSRDAFEKQILQILNK